MNLPTDEQKLMRLDSRWSQYARALNDLKSAKALAEAAGVNEHALSWCKNGIRPLSKPDRLRLCNYMGITIEQYAAGIPHPVTNMGPMSVVDMVRAHLVVIGRDGLANEYGCACALDNLAPCGGIRSDCVAGFVVSPNEGDFSCEACPACDFHVVSVKPTRTGDTP